MPSPMFPAVRPITVAAISVIEKWWKLESGLSEPARDFVLVFEISAAEARLQCAFFQHSGKIEEHAPRVSPHARHRGHGNEFSIATGRIGAPQSPGPLRCCPFSDYS